MVVAVKPPVGATGGVEDVHIQRVSFQWLVPLSAIGI
jgi:hypothetical protein